MKHEFLGLVHINNKINPIILILTLLVLTFGCTQYNQQQKFSSLISSNAIPKQESNHTFPSNNSAKENITQNFSSTTNNSVNISVNNSVEMKNITNLTLNENLESKFNLLSRTKTNLCAPPAFLNAENDAMTLQGSCCSPMNFDRYKEQLEGLKNYSNISIIPSDPYNISVSLAKELLSYDLDINLTKDEQTVYNGAAKLSKDKGPCCCKCWRWYAFEGLAKYLIRNYNFNSTQISEVWDLEDGCGGSS